MNLLSLGPKKIMLDWYEYKGHRIHKVKRGSWSVYEYSEDILIKPGLTRAQAVAFIDERWFAAMPQDIFNGKYYL